MHIHIHIHIQVYLQHIYIYLYVYIYIYIYSTYTYTYTYTYAYTYTNTNTIYIYIYMFIYIYIYMQIVYIHIQIAPFGGDDLRQTSIDPTFFFPVKHQGYQSELRGAGALGSSRSQFQADSLGFNNGKGLVGWDEQATELCMDDINIIEY